MPGDKKAAKGDEEMKQDTKAPASTEKEQKDEEKVEAKPLTAWEALRANVESLEKAVRERNVRGIKKSLWKTNYVRVRMTAQDLEKALQFLSNDVRAALVSAVGAISSAEATSKTDDDVDMAGESSPADDTTQSEEQPEKPVEPSKLPEVHAYVELLTMSHLFKYNLLDEALGVASQLVEYLGKFNRRTLDMFSARAFSMLSLVHEKMGTLSSIRGLLMKAHRTSSLRHDEFGKATLLNLLLRNYLHYNLYDQANKLRLRAPFPEAASNNQYIRYLYYTGRIHAVRTDYSDAENCLKQAIRKVPSSGKVAVGFRCTLHRLHSVVKLLMGDLPDRAVFREPELRTALHPHFRLAQAVRVGDLELFNSVLTEFADDFNSDSSYSLILRLRNNVIKAGLRKLSVAYSAISFADIAEKLHLGSAEDAAFLAAKAIKDGVVDGNLDFERGALVSNSTVDVYSTTEPQQTFHNRIQFCLDVRNEAVKGMTYPPNAHSQRTDDNDKTADDDMEAEETAKQVAEEDSDADE